MEDRAKIGLELILLSAIIIIAFAVIVSYFVVLDERDTQYNYNMTVLDKDTSNYYLIGDDGIQYYVSDFSNYVYYENLKVDSKHQKYSYYYWNREFLINHTYSCTMRKSLAETLVLSNCSEVK
jgi:hypothetical protein